MSNDLKDKSGTLWDDSNPEISETSEPHGCLAVIFAIICMALMSGMGVHPQTPGAAFAATAMAAIVLIISLTILRALGYLLFFPLILLFRSIKGTSDKGVRTGIATLSQTLPSAEDLLRDGIEMGRVEEYDDALETFALILKRHPDHVEANFYTGGCHYRLGNAKKARSFWEKVLELEPGHQKAQQYLRRIDEGL